MSLFIHKLEERLKQEEIENNVSITENGAVGYRSTGNALLNLNFSIPKMRTMDEEDIINMWNDAFKYDPMLSMRWLFYVRDVRGGLGERRIFKVILKYMADSYPEFTKHLIGPNRYVNGEIIPFYGRWDDLIDLIGTSVSSEVYRSIKNQLKVDQYNMNQNKTVSLLAKWLPSLTTSKKTNKLACKICKRIGMLQTPYRKLLSSLRKYLDVTEVKMSSNNWGKIDYEKVPSRASMIYENAFMMHDYNRYTKYINDVNSGKAKINASVLFPYEIVNKIRYVRRLDKDKVLTLEALWKNLKRGKEISNTIVVRDGSGSMSYRLDSRYSTTSADVCDALSIYFAEMMKGEFHNKIITFSHRPQLIDLDKAPDNKLLHKKLEYLDKYDEIADTNIEAVFDLILDIAIRNNLPQEELPKNILIISDMEFNACVVSNDNTPATKKLFDVIKDKYSEYDYKLPRVIFWNVNSRTGTIPMIENEMGVTLISGFSTNVYNMIMSEELDPFKTLYNQLMDKRYDPISMSLEEYTRY